MEQIETHKNSKTLLLHGALGSDIFSHTIALFPSRFPVSSHDTVRTHTSARARTRVRARLAPNSVLSSFRIGRTSGPACCARFASHERSIARSRSAPVVNQPPAGICSSMANKHARLMIYRGFWCARRTCSRSIGAIGDHSLSLFLSLSILASRSPRSLSKPARSPEIYGQRAESTG